jgi:hypothetical protein
MVAIRLPAVITEDRKLIIQLPENVPTGQVEVVIHAAVEIPAETGEIVNPAREAARAKLAAAGVLSKIYDTLPANLNPLSLEERIRIGTLPLGARPSEELISEDRDEE